MVNWIIIGIIVVAVFLFYKFTPLKYERFWTYLIALLLIFVLFTFFSVTKTNGIDLSTGGGFFAGAKFYAGWIFGLGKNAVQATGNVVHNNWSNGPPQNLTTPAASTLDEPKKKGWN